MRNLILFVCTITLFGGCKKNKDTTTPPATLNQWDGRYRIEGTMVDNKDPAFVWAGDTYEYSLHTSGTTTDSLVSKVLGFPGHLIKNGRSWLLKKSISQMMFLYLPMMLLFKASSAKS